MPYTPEQQTDLVEKHTEVLAALQNLKLQCVVQGQSLAEDSPEREHLLHGAGRRVGVILRSLHRIFEIFPPNTERPLEQDVLMDVQIYLHAFVINLYGIFDNWAWAFVYRHDLEPRIGKRQNVSLFKESTRRYLAAPLREYLVSDGKAEWHERYLKSYRDALAHRIPLYIPPATFTPEESQRHNVLESEKIQNIWAANFPRVEEIWAEQAALGRPCMAFLHSYREEGAPRPVLLHPQLISDAMAVVEFGELYLRLWHESVVSE